jgi:NADH dehydrogenase FAD-containing subunit
VYTAREREVKARRRDGRDADRRVALTEHAVVIAGGGPTGLTLAGIDAAIVDF